MPLNTLRLVVSAALLALILSRLDLAASFALLAGLPAWLFVAAPASSVLVLALASARWRQVVADRAEALPYSTMLKMIFAGAFVNQGLPTTLGGDALRTQAFAAASGARWVDALAWVVTDRLVAILALPLLVCLVSPLLWPYAPQAAWLLWIGPAAFACLAAGAVLFLNLHRIAEGFTPAYRWQRRLKAAVLKIELVGQFFVESRNRLRTLLIALATIAMQVVTVVLIANALAIELPLAYLLGVTPLALLVTTLPISVSGWGVREGAFVALFGLLGTPAESAFALSVCYGLSQLVASLPGARLQLRLRRTGQAEVS